MNKIWLVIKYEYLKHVKKKRFILAILSLPLFILLMVGVGFLSVVIQFDNTPIGYIDNSGLLEDPIAYEFEAPLWFMEPMEVQEFNDLEFATKELDDGSLQAIYFLGDDLIKSNTITVYANEIPDPGINNDFLDFLRFNLLQNTDPSIVSRVTEGAKFEVRSTEDDRNTSGENILGFVLPFISGFLFIMAINISGGYLLQAVVEEKENRTMEILVTSISPNQLMTGKVIGNLSVGLTQLVVWIIFGILGYFAILRIFPDLNTGQIDLSFLILTIAVFIPAFVMVAAMMAALGATTTETKEAQQIAGLFTLPMVIPFWFVQVLMEKPNSLISIFMSIFPFTAPVSLPIRAAFSNIPIWQTVLTVLLLILFAIAALWLAGRSFRLGMLRYGKKLSLKEILSKRY
ncbi:MAG TPA: ABC transporter permease [Anaerolineaceae bacterium]|nr:ABC transporter permease [Anaerolineaceae bacterium]